MLIFFFNVSYCKLVKMEIYILGVCDNGVGAHVEREW